MVSPLFCAFTCVVCRKNRNQQVFHDFIKWYRRRGISDDRYIKTGPVNLLRNPPAQKKARRVQASLFLF